MHKETITYEDFNGVWRTEDFYFNISRVEARRMMVEDVKITGAKIDEQGNIDDSNVKESGGLIEKFQRIIEEGNGKVIMQTFEDFIRMSYGRKSEDGRSFVKSDEATEAFCSSPAYDVFFEKIVTDADKAALFVNNVIPQGMGDQDKPAPGARPTTQIQQPDVQHRNTYQPPVSEAKEETPGTNLQLSTEEMQRIIRERQERGEQ